MLRNWLVLVSEKNQASQINERSNYKAVGSLKEVRVSLLSGEYTGIVVLDILETDTKGFPGFITSLKNHPELKKIQVVLLDKLSSLFPSEDKVELRFYTLEQIAKLIDLDLVFEDMQDEVLQDDNQIEKIEINQVDSSNDSTNSTENLEYLKHVCAKVIANMIIDGELSGDKGEVLEVLSQRVRES